MDRMRNDKRRRVIALLSREEIEFLDRIGLDALFSTGSKLSRIDVIKALVRAGILLNVKGTGTHNAQELIEKILEAAYSYSDRRQYPRLKRNLIVGFRKMDSMTRYEKARTGDISVGGFRIDVTYLGKPLAVNQLIEITIRDPRDTAQYVRAIGRVSWVKDKEDSHVREIGVKLTYIRKEDEKRFFSFINDDVSKNADVKG